MAPPGLAQVLVGWLVLALYLGFGMPIGLCAAVVAGSLDSAHQIYLNPGPYGVELVLHHDAGLVDHEHGLIAQTLTVFAPPPTRESPDHVIHFGLIENLSSRGQISPRPSKLAEGVVTAWPSLGKATSFCEFILTDFAGPPDNQRAQQLRQRSTVILI